MENEDSFESVIKAMEEAYQESKKVQTERRLLEDTYICLPRVEEYYQVNRWKRCFKMNKLIRFLNTLLTILVVLFCFIATIYVALFKWKGDNHRKRVWGDSNNSGSWEWREFL